MMWWDSLTFVEKRMAKHRDHLVGTTENAIMQEVAQFYQRGAGDNFDENVETTVSRVDEAGMKSY